LTNTHVWPVNAPSQSWGWYAIPVTDALLPAFRRTLSRRLLGPSTFTSGIHESTQRMTCLRPVVSKRISTRPSRRIWNSCEGCHCRSVT